MQLNTIFSDLALGKRKPATVWFQQKRVVWTYHYFYSHNTIVMQFKKCSYDAASTPLFYYFRPWVLKLRGVEGL